MTTTFTTMANEFAKKMAQRDGHMVECFTSIVKKAVEEQTKDYLTLGKTLAVTYGASQAVLKHVFGPAFFRFPATKAARQDTLMDLKAEFKDKNPEIEVMATPNADHPGYPHERDPASSSVADMGLYIMRRHADDLEMAFQPILKEIRGALSNGSAAKDMAHQSAKHKWEVERKLLVTCGEKLDADLQQARKEIEKLQKANEGLHRNIEDRDRELAEALEREPSPELPAFVQRAMATQDPVPMDTDTTGTFQRPERVAISDPEKFSGDVEQKLNIHLWLRGLERYFVAKNQPVSHYGRLAGHWLTHQALTVWKCELTDLEDKGVIPTWDHFKN